MPKPYGNLESSSSTKPGFRLTRNQDIWAFGASLFLCSSAYYYGMSFRPSEKPFALIYHARRFNFWADIFSLAKFLPQLLLIFGQFTRPSKKERFKAIALSVCNHRALSLVIIS